MAGSENLDTVLLFIIFILGSQSDGIKPPQLIAQNVMHKCLKSIYKQFKYNVNEKYFNLESQLKILSKPTKRRINDKY